MDESLMALIGTISLSRGLAALEMGRDAAAASYASKALETFESQGDQLGAAEAYRVFGGIFAARDEWDTAEQFFGHSLQVTDSLENPLGSAEKLRAWAIAYDKAGQAGRALTKNCEAQILFAEVGADNRTPGNSQRHRQTQTPNCRRNHLRKTTTHPKQHPTARHERAFFSLHWLRDFHRHFLPMSNVNC